VHPARPTNQVKDSRGVRWTKSQTSAGSTTIMAGRAGMKHLTVDNKTIKVLVW
jgi:ribosomal protein L3